MAFTLKKDEFNTMHEENRKHILNIFSLFIVIIILFIYFLYKCLKKKNLIENKID